MPVIGEIDFHLTHIELASFTIGACNATFAAPEGVGVTVSDLSMALTLDWQLRLLSFYGFHSVNCRSCYFTSWVALFSGLSC